MAELNNTNPHLLKAVMEINQNQRRRAVFKLRKALGGSLTEREIGVLGIAFKPNTDDIREAAALEIIHLLENEGAHVRAYDPQAMENAAKVLKNVKLCKDPYQVADGADAIVLVTEWNEFKQLDFKRIKQSMKTPTIMDGRNQWDGNYLRSLGFSYFGVGQGNHVEML
jgi:UDPglucose 6-dehydrogenase